MSRNKFILLFAILVIIYLVMPSEGIYGSIKANVVLALPFLMMGVIIYFIHYSHRYEAGVEEAGQQRDR